VGIRSGRQVIELVLDERARRLGRGRLIIIVAARERQPRGWSLGWFLRHPVEQPAEIQPAVERGLRPLDYPEPRRGGKIRNAGRTVPVAQGLQQKSPRPRIGYDALLRRRGCG